MRREDSKSMSNNNYKPGNPEYDFWNDKNLYPDLRNDYDDRPQPKQPVVPSNTKVGGGTVFFVIFAWIFFMAPFALFFTWQDWIVQIIFWGGLTVVLLVFSIWFYDVIKEEQREK